MTMLNKLLCLFGKHKEAEMYLVIDNKPIPVRICQHCVDIKTLRSSS